jgi:hypothetical protein
MLKKNTMLIRTRKHNEKNASRDDGETELGLVDSNVEENSNVDQDNTKTSAEETKNVENVETGDVIKKKHEIKCLFKGRILRRLIPTAMWMMEDDEWENVGNSLAEECDEETLKPVRNNFDCNLGNENRDEKRMNVEDSVAEECDEETLKLVEYEKDNDTLKPPNEQKLQ